MAKSNICYHNVRPNLDNEQHCRVHKVLAGLNTDIHKSVNQFIVDAVDSYIRSLNGESLVKDAAEQKAARHVTMDDFIEGGVRINWIFSSWGKRYWISCRWCSDSGIIR